MSSSSNINTNIDNSQTNKKQVVNVSAPQKTKTAIMPIAIPTGRNKAPPPPQVFVPVATNPAPITYQLNPPNDPQDLLNQPAAVMLGEGPEMAAYASPVYTTEAPTDAPIDQAQAQPQAPQDQLVQLAQLAAASAAQEPETPFWKTPKFIVPFVVLIIVAIILWFAFRGPPKPRVNGGQPQAPRANVSYYNGLS
jgi:hypothetical protein